MRMLDSTFLCLDIGTCGVRGVAHRIRNARPDKSAYYSIDDFDTVFALKAVIDELESQIGRHFDTAYITGNFGPSYFCITSQNDKWQSDHKITESDIKHQLAKIDAPDGYFPMHIIPLRYDTPRLRNMLSPIGHTDRQLVSTFSALFFNNEQMQTLLGFLRQAHIQPDAFYAPQFIANSVYKQPGQNIMFLDMGAENTTLSIWTDRGPVWYNARALGGNDLTDELSKHLSISFLEAERIKRAVATLQPNEMARFSPADTAYAFSCADVNDIVVPFYANLIKQIKNDSENYIKKYSPTEIVLTGGGANIDGLVEILSDELGIPIKKLKPDATVRMLSEFIWQSCKPQRMAYIARIRRQKKLFKKLFGFLHFKKKKKRTIVPIMPSSLCFDMARPETYTMFRAGGIQAIHIDIMDGLYVDKIAGGLEDLQKIRDSWNGHLHVHLMTDAPDVWAAGAINAGADTIILSTNTAGLRKAVQLVHKSGKRVGIALNPDSPISILKTILRELDEVMIMAVAPGAAGQKFNSNVIHKISALAATRKKYGLKFTISVDGGINAETAQLCWAAGANALVSGSYLASAPDFPLAVLSLLPKNKNLV